jgi:hypothetical protein
LKQVFDAHPHLRLLRDLQAELCLPDIDCGQAREAEGGPEGGVGDLARRVEAGQQRGHEHLSHGR